MSLVLMNNLQLLHCHRGCRVKQQCRRRRRRGFSVRRANVFVGRFLSLSFFFLVGLRYLRDSD